MLSQFAGHLLKSFRTLSGSRRRTAASIQNRVAAQIADLESRQMLAGTWSPLATPNPAGSSGTMLLLTDGTVIVQGGGVSKTWTKLTPDATGNYHNGTWSNIASMSREREYTGSVVLPSGKVLVMGGYFSGPTGALDRANTGEIYDPVTNTWSPARNFPQTQFGDDNTILLPNGKILAGANLDQRTYLYDPVLNEWTATGTKIHDDRSDQETWLLLPDGSVLAYDSYASPESGVGKAQRYIPATGTWVDAGVVPIPLIKDALGRDVGAATVLPNGKAIFVGQTGETAIYTPNTNTWAIGPVVPPPPAKVLDTDPLIVLKIDDGPAAMLPDGKFIFSATWVTTVGDPAVVSYSPKLYEYDFTVNTIVDITPAPAIYGGGGDHQGWQDRMLLLPNGKVLFNNGGGALFEYTPAGVPQNSWRPTIANIAQSASSPTNVYTLIGTKINGISEGASYSDPSRMSTNFPIVRMRNAAGVVKYAKTTNWTPGLTTSNTRGTVEFTYPAGFAANDVFQIAVIANGIASAEFTYGTEYLVKDINVNSASTDPQSLTKIGNTLFFSADNGLKGRELWKSDGTAAGTVLVKDIRTGIDSSNPSNFININGTLFFTADNGKLGTELWKSDGTTAGTVMVADIFSGAGSATPINLTDVNGTLFFGATNGKAGIELWKSNGTAAGTVMVKDIRPGVQGSVPLSLTNSNGTLFFTASNGVNGTELWKSDGTSAGTVMVKDIWQGSSTSYPQNLFANNGIVYLSANSGLTGSELWKSDGTAAGTVLVKDIETKASVGSSPGRFAAYNGSVYFQATTLASGAELWKTDGTAVGTTLLKDLNVGVASSAPTSLFVFKGLLYFQVQDKKQGIEIGRTDGTTAGTVIFLNLNTTALNSSVPAEFTTVGNDLFFKAATSAFGFELWKTDGTAAGTKQLIDLNFESPDGNPSNLVLIQDKLFFAGNNGYLGNELYAYNTGLVLPASPVFAAALAPTAAPAPAPSILTASAARKTARVARRLRVG